MLYSAFLLGLLGSFHCIGMCGPIAMVLPVHKDTRASKTIKISLYHIGRILAYGSIGLLFGFLGKGLFLSGFQQRLSIIIGVIIVGYILLPKNWIRKIEVTTPLYQIVARIKSGLGSRLKKNSFSSLFVIGFLNGYLPCGMVYMAVVGAVAMATPQQGFLYMLLYGVGTIPLMTMIIYFKHLFSIKFRNNIQKAIPYFVFLIGVLFILRGLGVGIPYLSPSDASLQLQNNGATCAPIEVN